MIMILITGATGHFGTKTIETLLKKNIRPNHIVAFVRDITKAEYLEKKGIILRKGDYDNYTSLINAFKDVDQLLLISGNDINHREKQQENVIKAAKEAKIKHITYTSLARKDESDSSPIAIIAKAHINTEKAIINSGLAYTILRNNLYSDTLPMFMGENILNAGIFLPAGEGRIAFASRNDMAEATAIILSTKGHENKIYHFSNIENVDFYRIAVILSEITRKNIKYLNPDIKTYRHILSTSETSKEALKSIISFAEAMKAGEFEEISKDLEMLLGRPPQSVKEYLYNIYS